MEGSMNNFWKNIRTTLTGTLTAQAIPIIGSVFLARIYLPSEFGKFSSWLAFVAIGSIALTLRFEAALNLIENGAAKIKAAHIILYISAFTSILLSLAIIACRKIPVTHEYLPQSTILLLLLTPSSLFLALNQVWQTWAASEGWFSTLNTMRVIQAASLISIQILAGYHAPSAESLGAAFFIANLFCYLVSYFKMPKISSLAFVTWQEFRGFLARYRKFPKYALPADSINTAAAQLPIIIVTYRFGHESAGLLALALRVMGAPIGLIGKAVLDVFKRDAIESIRKIGNCRDLYLKILELLTIGSIFIVIGTIALAEPFFKLAFGETWIMSGQIAIWLLPMFTLRMIASPLSYIAYLVEKQHVDLIWQIALLGSTLASLLLPLHLSDALIIYGLGYAMMYLIYLKISFTLSQG